jgi:hypothetical protein
MGLEGNFSCVTCSHLSQISTGYTSLSIKKGSLFCLSHRDAPNHIVSHDVIGILGKPLMSMSAPRVFGSV